MTLSLDLDDLLRRLHLPTVRRLHPDLCLQAEAEGLRTATSSPPWWRRRSPTVD